MSKNKLPANRILKKLNMTAANLADKLKVDRSTVSRWTYPPDRGGTGGIIPQRHHREIITLAKSVGVDMELDDFVMM